ncbi:hypothetical protein ACQP00_01130 [Dactylosporangium sp. CS-047395]|uniref:hypothetical protein n=1 Tax=Dactylosporangium sp. CS-047395 TaxID=3239936 RepID=UPI003D921F91
MNAALGEISAGQELAYIGLLCVSGLIAIAIGAVGFGLKSTGQRVLNIVIGVAFIAYGLYLLIGQPETVYVIWYVFIVPIILIINVVKAARASKA